MHDSDLMTLCDWIEASVLFTEPEISKAALVAALVEGNIYLDQDPASEMIDNTWTELRRRQQWLGDSVPFEIQRTRIERKLEWSEALAHSFCLVLTVARDYGDWAGRFGTNYSLQGHLFERVTMESLNSRGWDVYHAGWASGITTRDFGEIVRNVSDRLNEGPVNEDSVRLYQSSNEAGLDLLCYRPFADRRGGKPVYLVQCASGKNWEPKARTPDINVWKSLITYSSRPVRGFAVPFAYDDDQFKRLCFTVEGLVIDRYRLLSVQRREEEWLSPELQDSLRGWLHPRISDLPIDG